MHFFSGGVDISSADVLGLLTYRLLTPAVRDGRGWPTGSEQWPPEGPFGDAPDKAEIPGSPPYWSSGFLSLQMAIDSVFIEVCKGICKSAGLSLFALVLQCVSQKALVIFTVIVEKGGQLSFVYVATSPPPLLFPPPSV